MVNRISERDVQCVVCPGSLPNTDDDHIESDGDDRRHLAVNSNMSVGSLAKNDGRTISRTMY